MKNTALIKAGIVIGVVVLIIVAIMGNLIKKKGEKETRTAHTEFSSNSRVEPTTKRETQTQKESTQDTESYTMQVEFPSEFPEAEPEPEGCDNVPVKIYFTNTKDLDSSNLLPLTAWETLSSQAQDFLNYEQIMAKEIRVTGKMEKKDNKVSFDSIFPDIPDSHFTVTYDLDLRQFSFQVKVPGKGLSSGVESPDDETGGM